MVQRPHTCNRFVSSTSSLAVRLNWQSVTEVFQNWDVTNRSHFKDLLYSDTYQARLDEFTKTNFRDSETAATAFTNILQDIIYKVFPRRRKRGSQYKPRPPSRPFNHECQIAKRLWKKAKRSFNKDTDCLNRRHRYLTEKRKYKKCIYRAKKKVRESFLHKLSDLESKDPKNFWNSIQKLIKPKDNVCNYIELPRWLHHFKKLLDPPSPTNIDK